MTIHDAWASSANTAPPTGDLCMDELTAHQLADELTTLAASMFGLLQAHPGSDSTTSESPAAGSAAPFVAAPQRQDPASVTSVAIPVEPVVDIAVPEEWGSPESEAVDFAADQPDADLAVPALAVPEVGDGLDKLDQRESAPDEREAALDQRESVDHAADQPAVEFAVPALEVPELDLREQTPPVLRLVEPIEVHELEPQDQETPDREAPAPRQSMALLNEIAFLDE